MERTRRGRGGESVLESPMRRLSVCNQIAHLYSKCLNKGKYAPILADVGTRANDTVVLWLCKCLFITITLPATCQEVQGGVINLNFEGFSCL